MLNILMNSNLFEHFLWIDNISKQSNGKTNYWEDPLHFKVFSLSRNMFSVVVYCCNVQ